MNDDILKGKWAQLKGKVKEQWCRRRPFFAAHPKSGELGEINT